MKISTLVKDFNQYTELHNISVKDNLAWTWDGAVVAIIQDDKLCLILRSEDMPGHKGQLAFPGGHKHVGEKTPLETATRELAEECGLLIARDVEFLGYLKAVQTQNQKWIIPVLAKSTILFNELIQKLTSNGEWTRFITISIDDLMQSELWSRGKRASNINEMRSILFYAVRPSAYWAHDGMNIEALTLWGATAQMIFDNLDLFLAHKGERS